MAGTIKISTDQVEAIAASIENNNKKLKSTLEDSQSAVKSLSSTWQGEAAQSTISAYDTFATNYFQTYYDIIDAYVKFCAQNLNMYFSAVKNAFRDEWRNQESKLLSVISINGFIMAYNRQLRKNGLREYDFYQNSFGKMQMDFSKEGFPYTSSQYRMFSNKILMEAFGFSQEEIQNC